MSTTTTNYGLIKPDTTDPILIGQINDNMDTIDTVLKDHSDKIDAAALGIKYKGEVNYYADLPNNAEIGDAYTVKYAGSSGTTPDGTEYVWGAVAGTNQWINFSKDSYTKAEIDALLGGKVDKETGKGLSTNDYTTAEKTKLAGIAEGAEVNEIESIKVNNTTINPDANKVVNITVPTTAADVSALPDTTKYAAALSLTINSSTYVITGQLKDQNGDNLGAAQTIDLPLESVVVGGSYNSQTKKVVLTLQNGNTIEFSVADLVSGLQTELSANNKLNPAYINYDSTHRAVSDTEKSTWNGKQNAIDSSHKLSAGLVDDASSTNKFATAEELEQIQTNKNNISMLQQKTAKVYGFHVNPNESDSSAAVTYLMDAVGMTPAKMGSTAFDWGSWADAFFIPKPCMVKPDGTVDYYLNPNNYAQKLDGTASELATAPTDNLLSNISYTNNAMMEWGKIWFKYEAGQADGEWSFYVSNMNVDGTFKCWCNINANNNEIDHFYTAIYNGVGCKSKMRSVSGVKLSTTNEADTTTVAEETAAAAANNATTNPEWYTEVWSDRLLINALLYLMGKSLDLQGTFGNGLSRSTISGTSDQQLKQNYITGSLDDKGLFYGDTSGTTTAVKVFGMENLWACCWRRIAGCILDNNVLKVKMTYDTADGSSAHGYNLTGVGYLDFGNLALAEGWLSKITVDSEKGYKPSTTQSNSSLYYKDYFYKNASIVAYLLLGGRSGHGARCGFYCNLSSGVSDASWAVSAALSLKRWG